jgi:hypothetical protein
MRQFFTEMSVLDRIMLAAFILVWVLVQIFN